MAKVIRELVHSAWKNHNGLEIFQEVWRCPVMGLVLTTRSTGFPPSQRVIGPVDQGKLAAYLAGPDGNASSSLQEMTTTEPPESGMPKASVVPERLAAMA